MEKLEDWFEFEEEGNCCICGKKYTHWGNNALPIKDGRCCDKCNELVTQKRIEIYYK